MIAMTAPRSTATGEERESEQRPNQAVDQPGPVAPKLDFPTRLAIERTRAAYDRTMMAWVRTATSLITFGFTVYKFFQLQRYEDFERRHKIGPREFGLTMVSIGLLSLVMAAWENRHYMRALRAQYPELRYSMATALAALIFALGMAGFVVMILRV
jgi:putative membrane protein